MTKTVLEQVKDHALANYDKGGWDVIVECYTDDELLVAIKGATTLAQAIDELSARIDVWSDRQAFARSEADNTPWSELL